MGVLARRFRAVVTEAFEQRAHDWNVLPSLLSAACVEVLPVTGAGLSLVQRLRVPLGASDKAASLAERLQTTLGEGPCLSAVAAGEPLVAGQEAMRQRWPMFHDKLVEQTPFRSVAAFPLRLPGQLPYTALDLYSASNDIDPSLIDDRVQDEIVAQIAAFLLGAPPTLVDWSDQPVPVWLTTSSTAARTNVWVAVGMVMAAASENADVALALLRGYAFSHDITLDELAELLTTAQLAPTVVTD